MNERQDSPVSCVSRGRSKTVIRPRPRWTSPWTAYSLRIFVVVSREVPARAATCSWVSWTWMPRASRRRGSWSASRHSVVATRCGTLLKTVSESRRSSCETRLPRISEMRAAIRASESRKRLHVRPGHDADGDRVEGLGEVVVHLLAEHEHLAEDGPGREDRGRERTSVGGHPEDADPSLLEDEERLHGLGRRVEQLAWSVLPHRCRRGDGRHLLLVEVGEDVHLGHAPGEVGPFRATLHVDKLLTASRRPRPHAEGVEIVKSSDQTVRRRVAVGRAGRGAGPTYGQHLSPRAARPGRPVPGRRGSPH